jgi:L,D-transpeptidase catalytic domain
MAEQKPVEFDMRRHAVMLAVALAWLISFERAEARLDILVDKSTQRMLVIQNGYMRYMWPVSTGRDETATPNGVYSPQRLERNWFSSAYYNSPMPYSIFFHNGYAIHGSYAIDRLGGPASHGCVRLHPHHAALLFDLVQQEGPKQTTIEIADEARPGGPPPMPPQVITADRGAYPPVPPRDIAAERGPYPPMPPREIGAERGPYPPMPPREIAAERGPYPPVPPREIAAEREPYPPMPREFAAEQGPYAPGPSREMGAERGPYPPMPREFAAERGSYPAGPRREIVAERGPYSPGPRRELALEQGAYPVPRVIRYRENGDMGEPTPIPRANRPLAARNSLPPPALSPPPARRLVNDVRSPTSIPRAPCDADAANGSPRSSDASDCRPKPKLVEASPPRPAPQPQPALQAQAAPSPSTFKLLPASCWTGGASRWRGGSSQAPCK